MGAAAEKAETKAFNLHKLPEKLGQYPISRVRLLHTVVPVTMGDPHRGPVHELRASEGLLLAELPNGDVVFSGKWVGRVPAAAIAFVEYRVP